MGSHSTPPTDRNFLSAKRIQAQLERGLGGSSWSLGEAEHQRDATASDEWHMSGCRIPQLLCKAGKGDMHLPACSVQLSSTAYRDERSETRALPSCQT